MSAPPSERAEPVAVLLLAANLLILTTYQRLVERQRRAPRPVQPVLKEARS
jgi:hypothetical protein